MDNNILNKFNDLFKEFTSSKKYTERTQQFCFVPIAKDIIEETLKNNSLTNEHLTGLIQMFKWDCSDVSFDKYLGINIKDKKIRNQLSDRAYECGQNGYTGAGLRTVRDLNSNQLTTIKNFLLAAYRIKTIKEAIDLCNNYDSNKIPLVTKGIYSPWLYYINNEIFPIINQSHNDFLKWMNTSQDYSESIKLFDELKKRVNEKDLGLIDIFAHNYKAGDDAIRILNLNGRKLYKMSHGAFLKRTDFRRINAAKKLEDENWICLHESTGKSQAEAFENAEIGDYFFLCYGGDRLRYIGKIISDSDYIPSDKMDIVDNDEGWIFRKIEPLFQPIDDDISDFKNERSFWMPSGNSTFYPVPDSDLDYANREIFIPKYRVKIIDDISWNQNKINKMPALNTILYGPPGTGKTYNTILKAAEIISGKILEYNEAKAVFEPLLGDQVEFITFHQNFTYEDFVVGLRPKLHGNQLAFEKNEGVFYKICKRARENYTSWKEGLEATEPKFEAVLYEYLKPLQTAGREIEVKLEIANKAFYITKSDADLLSYRSEDGSVESLNIAAIKALFNEGRSPTDGKHTYYTPLVKALKVTAEKLKKEQAKVELKKYVLIIDEINRANISRVFGELITLLEEDKRLGNKHQMLLSLSNSERFSVPNNLFIVGTMNTADKSIALIDIALRRRFVFEPMYPTNELIDQLVKAPFNEFLKALNNQIFEKKGADFLIGHSYFMVDEGEELNFLKVINQRIIPLLNEYFYNQRNVSILQLLQKAIEKISGYTVEKDDYVGVVCKQSL